MPGFVVSWDNDYTEVKREGTTVAATCRVSYQDGGAGGSTRYKLRVLARDEALGRYIALQLEPDAVTGEELKAIARSVRFNPWRVPAAAAAHKDPPFLGMGGL